jgi:preprotein translocase subunit YajC
MGGLAGKVVIIGTGTIKFGENFRIVVRRSRVAR